MGDAERSLIKAVGASAILATTFFGTSPTIAVAPDSRSLPPNCAPSSPSLVGPECDVDGSIGSPPAKQRPRKSVVVTGVGNSLVNINLKVGDKQLGDVFRDYVRSVNPVCDVIFQTTYNGRGFAKNGAKFTDVYYSSRDLASSLKENPPGLAPPLVPKFILMADGTNDAEGGIGIVSGDTAETYKASMANLQYALTRAEDGIGNKDVGTVYLYAYNNLPNHNPNTRPVSINHPDLSNITNVKAVGLAIDYAAQMPDMKNRVEVEEIDLSFLGPDDIQGQSEGSPTYNVHPTERAFIKIFGRINEKSKGALTCQSGSINVTGEKDGRTVVHLPVIAANHRSASSILAETYEKNEHVRPQESWPDQSK